VFPVFLNAYVLSADLRRLFCNSWWSSLSRSVEWCW